MLKRQTAPSLFTASYIALFFVNMIASVSFSMVSTVITLYLLDVGYSTTLAGTVVGLMSLAAMLVRPISGYICDWANRKRVLMLSMAGIALSMLGYSVSQKLVWLCAMRILHGACFSMVTTVTMAMVADCVPAERRGQGMGVFSIGQTITLALAPTLGLWLAQHFSYAATFGGAAAFAGGSILLAAVAYRADSPVRVRRTELRLEHCFAREAAWFAVIAAAVSATTSIENSFVADYGRQLAAGNVGWYFTLSAIALFVSRLVFGKVADRRGMKYVLYPGLAAMICAFICMSFANPGNVVVVFAVCAVLKALGLGAVQPTLQAASIAAAGEERSGAACGTYYFGTDVGQGLAPIVGGMIADCAGYGGTFAFFALPLLLSGSICALRERRKAE